MKRKIFIILFVFAAFSVQSEARNVRVNCTSGDGIYTMLEKYDLNLSTYNCNKFRQLNKGKIKRNGHLYTGTKYQLPISICTYKGGSIRSSLGISDFNTALDIQKYNERILAKGIISSSYKKSGIIYVPHVLLSETSDDIKTTGQGKTGRNIEKSATGTWDDVYFGCKVRASDSSLRNCVFYLSPGHGGPDPGAIGIKNGHKLCEDEYAYDVTLRLAACLRQHGAIVYMVIKDKNDGIRGSNYLSYDDNEVYCNGDPIPCDQKKRLLKKAALVNQLYAKHRRTAKKQIALMIHVDSRFSAQRIDIFYYHNPGSVQGKKLANALYNTIESKYNENQPGRGYYGSVSTRNLLELKSVVPTAVYIELGNLQNPNDQMRFIDPNNRQAIANWLYLGLLRGM